MIDLFSVKINGRYDDIGCYPSIENGTFLCCETNNIYTRGCSYQITNNQPVRIETAQDCKIKNTIYPAIQNTCEWLNNWFTIKRNYADFWTRTYNYGSSGSWHEVPQTPSNGDLCKVRKTMDWEYIDEYSFFFVSYVTVDDSGVITCDNPKFVSGQNYFYYIMHLPEDVEKIIGSMIYYDIFTRGEVDGLKSENTGNYSYTKEDVTVGSLSYPSEIVAGLESTYKKVRFV